MLPGARMLFSRRMEKLAYDAEIEFLESTGTQWLDTEFYPDLSTLSCEIKLRLVSSANDGLFGLFGVRAVASSDTKNNCSILTNPSKHNLRIDWYKYLTVYADIGEDYEFSCGTGNRVVINGTEYEETSTPKVSGYSDYSFYLFATNSVGTPMALCNQRVYHAKIHDNGTLVRDLIPVRKGNIGYMYDRVSGRLFGNSGTGEFVLGPDIIDYTAKDYVQDGLVAMWDGIENAGWGVHDANATVWKDLIGNLDATAINSPVFGDNHTDTSNGYWSLPSSVREIIEMQSLTAEVAFQPSTSGATIANQGIVGMGNNRSLWLFFGNPPLSGTTLNWQVRKSPSIRAWYNSGVFGTDAHSCSVVANNSVCNTYLDSALCTITPDVAAGSATSTDKFYIGMMSENVDWHTFHGRIHSVRLYSRALTVEEIAHNYEIDKARFGL